MTPRFASLLAAAALAGSASGCFWVTTKSEGTAIRSDIRSLDGRLAAKETEIDGKVAELQKTLDEAAKLLKRNSADIGAEVERLDEGQRTALGLVTAAQANAEEVRVGLEKFRQSMDERLAALDARLATLEKAAVKPVVEGPTAEDLWRQGKKAFEESRWEDAAEAYKQLVVKFPTHARAGDAQYFRAETFFSRQDWESAIREYQRVFDKFPDNQYADDAMFRAGEAAAALKSCTEARAYFQELVTKYPSSNLAKRAGEKDKELKAAAKNKKVCAS